MSLSPSQSGHVSSAARFFYLFLPYFLSPVTCRIIGAIQGVSFPAKNHNLARNTEEFMDGLRVHVLIQTGQRTQS